MEENKDKAGIKIGEMDIQSERILRRIVREEVAEAIRSTHGNSLDDTDMITREEAARLAGVSLRTISNWIGRGLIETNNKSYKLLRVRKSSMIKSGLI